MSSMHGRVCVVTGAGRGLGREHALLLASEGAAVVVNDVDREQAATTASDIIAAGGEAVVNADDISGANEAQRVIEQAVSTFGELHVVVNNAGIVRPAFLFDMEDADFDEVLRVNLRGHFCVARAAARHWHSEPTDGLVRSLVNTTSSAGLFGLRAGRTAYGASKAAIAAMSQVWARDLQADGVRVNCISPSGRTRLSRSRPDASITTDETGFDPVDPANVSPLVGYLASAPCAFTGHTFYVQANQVTVMRGWGPGPSIRTQGRWTVDGLVAALEPLRGEPAFPDRTEIDQVLAHLTPPADDPSWHPGTWK
jgi:NAD(P)-dependent dehydrogenase (short-subunit alcohol dehydrogenase family)